MRTLILDDDPTHHEAFQRGIGKLPGPQEICSVFDAESALLMLTPIPDDEPWDLVLLDHVLDGEDGLAVVRLLASLPVEQRPRLVAVTTGDGKARARMLAVLWEAWMRAVACPVTELDPTNLKLAWLPAMLPVTRPAKKAS
jgi:CheY-like chemotaxis protein